MFVYRPYQQNVIDGMMEHANSNCCALSATGTGKSAMIRGFVERLLEEYPDESICVTVHVKEVLDGLKGALKGLPVEFRTIQKLSRGEEYFDRIIIDEVQHIPAKSYKKVISTQCKAFFGFTALPTRGLIPEYPPNIPINKDVWKYELTGIKSDDLFKHFVFGLSTKEAIEQGYLTDYRLVCDKAFHIEQNNKRLHDFNEEEINNSVTPEECATYIDKTLGDKKAIVFAHSIKYGEKIVKLLGDKAQFLSSKSNKKVRESVFNEFKHGDLQVLVNVNLFTEGVDVPTVDCCYLFRPTRSLPVYFQQIGRALRLAEGKTEAIIYDYVNNRGRLGVEPKDIQLQDTLLLGTQCKESCEKCGAFGIVEGDKDKTCRPANTKGGAELKRIIRKYYSDISLVEVKKNVCKLKFNDYTKVSFEEQLEIYQALNYQETYRYAIMPVYTNKYGQWEVRITEKTNVKMGYSNVLMIHGQCKYSENTKDHDQMVIMKNYEKQRKERSVLVK